MSIGLSIRWIWISFAFINIKERGNYFFGGRAGDLILGNLQQLIHHFHIGMEEDDEEKKEEIEREKRGLCSFFTATHFQSNETSINRFCLKRGMVKAMVYDEPLWNLWHLWKTWTMFPSFLCFNDLPSSKWVKPTWVVCWLFTPSGIRRDQRCRW